VTPAELQTEILGLNLGLSLREAATPLTIKVEQDHFLSLMTLLARDPRFQFDMLQLHTALDWPAENRLECLYLLNSSKLNHEIMVSISVPRAAALLPSVSAIWAIAEWQEREVFDMFGVLYSEHPDLRRLLLDDDWKGFPLRKDYQDDFVLSRPW